MSGWPRVIEDELGSSAEIKPRNGEVNIYIAGMAGETASLYFTVDQCAALIAAITDAAKVVTGDKS